MRAGIERGRFDRLACQVRIVFQYIVGAVAAIEATQHRINRDPRAAQNRRSAHDVGVDLDIVIPRLAVASRTFSKVGTDERGQIDRDGRRDLQRLGRHPVGATIAKRAGKIALGGQRKRHRQSRHDPGIGPAWSGNIRRLPRVPERMPARTFSSIALPTARMVASVAIVVGVKRPKEDFVHAQHDTVVAPGDLLIVAGATGAIQRFAVRCGVIQEGG